MNDNQEPKLAPPGAGLPAVELFIARLLFRLRFARGNRSSFTARFVHERDKIGKLVRSLTEAQAAKRVLIERPGGLEDSSRNWSAWMTLDHLRIVHLSINRTIANLLKDIVPEGKASTAAVKPAPDVTGKVVLEYEKSCDALIEITDGAANLKTTARFAHPWFGPLDAAGWHALAATHMAIHRVQLERIVQGATTEPR